jgi:predicted nucleic acid-binding protein
MRFLIDTSVWSEALQRKSNTLNSSQILLSRLINDENEIFLTGIILQEILSGITNHKLFNEIKVILTEFPYLDATKADYIYAAELRNISKSKGISTGSFDFLIASIAIQNNLTLVTTDKDFTHITKNCDLKLYNMSKENGNDI